MNIDLTTSYVGLKLKNPLLVASSGLTKDLRGVERANKYGAGGVVLKSLFEEQILIDSFDNESPHPEEYDYLKAYNINNYLKLIEESKKNSDIPVIASINCTTLSSWVEYARDIERQGASALEINIIPHHTKEYKANSKYERWFFNQLAIRADQSSQHVKNSLDIEDELLAIVTEVCSHISIPLVAKITPYITSLPHFTKRLADAGVRGAVLFNTLFTPDFNIHTKELLRTIAHSHPSQMHNTLRWIALLYGDSKLQFSATNGIHSSDICIKMLMAGAQTVQLCSVLYNESFKVIEQFLSEIKIWMEKNRFQNIEDFRGTLNKFLDVQNIFNRLQYVKAYNNFE